MNHFHWKQKSLSEKIHVNVYFLGQNEVGATKAVDENYFNLWIFFTVYKHVILLVGLKYLGI